MVEHSPFEQIVLREIAEIKQEVNDLTEIVVLARIDIATLKVKAGMWGAAAGMIPAILTAIVAYVAGVTPS
jgi:hypothetical protein